jgi:hypothetical protein
MPRSRFTVLALLVLSICLRLVTTRLALVTALDTSSYQELADRIAFGTLHGYGGMRTPVYPLFLLLAFRNENLPQLGIAQSARGRRECERSSRTLRLRWSLSAVGAR